MSSKVISDVREYEEKAAARIPDSDRPLFHLSSRIGWMNDPNGFSKYNGVYHLFYQYYPFTNQWGPMHWGHAVSKNLLQWQYLPVALAPDTEADFGGCFSGSAIETDDGKHLLLYTGVQTTDTIGQFIQQQCVAVGDGLDYEKYEGNPVIDISDLPEGFSKYDFRDPKIFRENDGTYACVVAACDQENDGKILYFRSEDGFKWNFVSVLAENNHRFGTMWECPDFFELDGRYVLLTSPMNMRYVADKYSPGNGTLCLIGSFDKRNVKFTEESDQAIDYGIDFYATQTLLTEDGRRIMIGWMQNWDSIAFGNKLKPWFGQMTLPRELHIRNGLLCQEPVREIETLRNGMAVYENVRFNGSIRLHGIVGRTVDIEITVKPAKAKPFNEFSIRFAENEDVFTSLTYNRKKSEIAFNRKNSGATSDVVHTRRLRIPTKNGELKVRLILDRYSVECFINDGEQTLTSVLYTEADATGFSFHSDGEVLMDVVKYDLGFR